MALLTHVALFYRDQEELMTHTLPFVQEGLDRGEPVLVAQPDLPLQGISQHFSGVPGLRLLNMREVGRNPGRIMPSVVHAFALEHPGRPLRIVAELLWPGRPAIAYPACVQHEAMINLVLADMPATMLCPYDTSTLSRQILDDAHRTHPWLIGPSAVPRPSSAFDVEELTSLQRYPLPPPPPGAVRLRFGIHDLGVLRSVVAAEANRAGLGPARTGSMQLAATEAAANAIRHGGGEGTLFLWQEVGSLLCEVQSALPLPEPTAGRLQPSPESLGGRGLIIINYLCDLVRWHDTGATSALRMWIGPGDR